VILYLIDSVENHSLPDGATVDVVPVRLVGSMRRSWYGAHPGMHRTSRRYLEYEIAFEV